MAAGVGDALAGADLGALLRGQFGQTESPVRIDAMRCRSVDDAGIRVVDEGDRLLGCIVWQAQEGDVGFVDQPFALGEILAFVGVDLEQHDIAALGEIFVDLQAGRTFLAVDKNFVSHGESAG